MVFLDRLVREQSGYVVQSGPFAGLRYIDRAVGSVLIPKLLGVYERELHPAIEAAIAERPATVIDLGAAEGYYAVGLAVALPGARVIAYEADVVGRDALRSLAERNGVRVDVRERCAGADLASDLASERGPVLIVCDIDGGELSVLDPVAVPGLATVTLIVETHGMIVPGTTETLCSRFAPTHAIEIVNQRYRPASLFPFRRGLARLMPRSSIIRTMSDKRPPDQVWLWMRPRA